MKTFWLQQKDLKLSLIGLLDDFRGIARLLEEQLPHENPVWMGGFRTEYGIKWQKKIKGTLRTVERFRKNGRSHTWARTRKERRESRVTMGLQLGSTRSLSESSDGYSD